MSCDCVGEDFIIQILCICETKEPEWDAAKKYIIDNSKTITEMWGKNAGYETEDKVVKCLIDDIYALKQCWDDYGRECVIFHHKGDKILITGGLSWGDNPTEAFGVISELGEAGILSILGFNVY